MTLCSYKKASRAFIFGVFNSIVEKSSGGATWIAAAPSNFGARRCPVSAYNLFRPAASDDAALSRRILKTDSSMRASDISPARTAERRRL